MARSDKERERITNARQSERRTLTAIQRLNSAILQVVAGLLSDLVVDAAGRILFNVQNIDTAQRVGFAVQSVYRREVPSLTGRIVRRMLRLFGINTEYFRQAEKPIELTATLENRMLNLIMKAYGYDTATGQVIPGGYLAGNLASPGHAQAISRRITEAIAGRMPLRDFIRTFRQEFRQPGSALSAQHHYNRFARDLYQEFDRVVQTEYAKSLGMEHAIYAGTVKDNTRHFCERRVNNIYTIEEINKWNGQEWQGKKPGDVKVNLGGYNCRHTLSWISEEAAERIAKRRGKEINEYN